MHQEEVNVVELKVSERLVKPGSNIIRVVFVVPQLRSDEELVARHAAFLDGIADLLFSFVAAKIVLRKALRDTLTKMSSLVNSHPGCVNVTVSCLERFKDRIFLRMGILPGAESDGRDLRSGV